MHAPTDTHMEAVKRILRYLKGTIGDGLTYKRMSPTVDGHIISTYTDADWGSDLDEHRSVSGYCVFLNSNLVCWSRRRQRAIAKSSTEAEYRAMAAGTADAYLASSPPWGIISSYCSIFHAG